MKDQVVCVNYGLFKNEECVCFGMTKEELFENAKNSKKVSTGKWFIYEFISFYEKEDVIKKTNEYIVVL